MSNLFRLPAMNGGPALQIVRQQADGPAVLYIHGATFPAALSVAYKIDGRSWMDDLNGRGFDAWALDFAGYGGSDPWPALGRAVDVVPQIERAVAHIREATKRAHLSVTAHSWGTIPAGMFTSRRPDAVERLVLFGPLAERKLSERPATHGENKYLVTADDQWRAFQWGVPQDEPSPIARAVFEPWAHAYLATDRESATHTPPAVRVPSGPDHDFADAWTGAFPYDPRDVRTPTLILRGEWDAVTTDADAAWLKQKLANARDVKLPRGAHRMHLEQNRQALFDAAGAFLTAAV